MFRKILYAQAIAGIRPNNLVGGGIVVKAWLRDFSSGDMRKVSQSVPMCRGLRVHCKVIIESGVSFLEYFVLGHGSVKEAIRRLSVQRKRESERFPLLHQAAAAIFRSGVSRFTVPNSSSSPHRPQAEPIGSPFLKGSSAQEGILMSAMEIPVKCDELGLQHIGQMESKVTFHVAAAVERSA
jgi:hypothetical protein